MNDITLGERKCWLAALKKRPLCLSLLTESLARQSFYAYGDVSSFDQSEHLFLSCGRRFWQQRKTGRDSVLSGSPASPLLWSFWIPWSFSRPKINLLSRYRALKKSFFAKTLLFITHLSWLSYMTSAETEQYVNCLASNLTLAMQLSQRLCCWGISCCIR